MYIDERLASYREAVDKTCTGDRAEYFHDLIDDIEQAIHEDDAKQAAMLAFDFLEEARAHQSRYAAKQPRKNKLSPDEVVRAVNADQAAYPLHSLEQSYAKVAHKLTNPNGKHPNPGTVGNIYRSNK